MVSDRRNDLRPSSRLNTDADAIATGSDGSDRLYVGAWDGVVPALLLLVVAGLEELLDEPDTVVEVSGGGVEAEDVVPDVDGFGVTIEADVSVPADDEEPEETCVAAVVEGSFDPPPPQPVKSATTTGTTKTNRELGWSENNGCMDAFRSKGR